MPVVLIGCSGFLLAVLWMDLMFDVQARHLDRLDAAARNAALTSITAYYRRVTTDAFPMNRLIAAVMVVQLGGIVDEVLVHPLVAGWRALAVALLGAAPIVVALARIVPAAARLGLRGDAVVAQAAAARAIYRAHLACVAAIAAFIAVQVRIAR